MPNMGKLQTSKRKVTANQTDRDVGYGHSEFLNTTEVQPFHRIKSLPSVSQISTEITLLAAQSKKLQHYSHMENDCIQG